VEHRHRAGLGPAESELRQAPAAGVQVEPTLQAVEARGLVPARARRVEAAVFRPAAPAPSTRARMRLPTAWACRHRPDSAAGSTATAPRRIRACHALRLQLVAPGRSLASDLTEPQRVVVGRALRARRARGLGCRIGMQRRRDRPGCPSRAMRRVSGISARQHLSPALRAIPLSRFDQPGCEPGSDGAGSAGSTRGCCFRQL
jgi:hypothetical protein